MKKTFLLISIFLLGSNLFAQDIVNGDFAINNGNDITYVPGCHAVVTEVTFSDSSVLNWIRSHGTPKLGSHHAAGAMVVGSGFLANTPFHPSDGKVNGSGVMANYNFERNVTYIVEVDLLSYTSTAGTIFFYAAKDIVRNLVMSLPGTNNCQSHIPVAGVKQVIGSITGVNHTFSTHTFTFTPSSNGLDKFWICPLAYDTGTGSNSVSAWVRAIRIKSVCKPQRTFASGIFPIASGLHRYEQIYAGSSFGSSSTPVKTNLNATTTFRAGALVEIKHNFIAEVNGNNTFVAEILPCEIIDNTPAPGPQLSGSENAPQSALVVFPNPATKEITARYVQPSDRGKTNFTITNSTGQVLLNHVSDGEPGSGEREQRFDISAFPPGTYFIQISYGQFKEIAKFTVMP